MKMAILVAGLSIDPKLTTGEGAAIRGHLHLQRLRVDVQQPLFLVALLQLFDGLLQRQVAGFGDLKMDIVYRRQLAGTRTFTPTVQIQGHGTHGLPPETIRLLCRRSALAIKYRKGPPLVKLLTRQAFS